MSTDNYRELVQKMGAMTKDRTSREEEVEQALNESMPGLLRRLMESNGGKVRPCLRDLNARLDEAGVSSNVSPNTFYAWLDKYRLR